MNEKYNADQNPIFIDLTPKVKKIMDLLDDDTTLVYELSAMKAEDEDKSLVKHFYKKPIDKHTLRPAADGSGVYQIVNATVVAKLSLEEIIFVQEIK